MTTSTELPATIRGCFLPNTVFADAAAEDGVSEGAVRVARVRPDSEDPPGLDSDSLPFLALPDEAGPIETGDGSALVLVAVEGRDEFMADALAGLLDPASVRIGLVHVTWVPGIAGSPLDRGGIDDPQPSDLLAYQGAREALIGTTTELHRYGFTVATHLRESRDPAQSIADLIEREQPALLALGLGRHGAGIGRRVMERVRVATLFVRAR